MLKQYLLIHKLASLFFKSRTYWKQHDVVPPFSRTQLAPLGILRALFKEKMLNWRLLGVCSRRHQVNGAFISFCILLWFCKHYRANYKRTRELDCFAPVRRTTKRKSNVLMHLCHARTLPPTLFFISMVTLLLPLVLLYPKEDYL